MTMDDLRPTTDVHVELSGSLAVLTIDGPQSHNAISRPAMDALSWALDEVEASSAHVVAIRGAGDRVFVSGGDLKELSTIRTVADAEAMARRMRDLLDRVAGLPMPVVAVLNGSAFGGGCELAVACDLRVAPADVRLAFNQIELGIMPAWGGLERLTSLVGSGRAMRMALTGESIDAATAHGWGLVDVLVTRDELDARVQALLERLAAAPRAAVLGIKSVARPSVLPVDGHVEAAISAFARTWVHEDHWAAVDRMQERRRAGRSS